MADKEIGDLTSGTALDGTETIHAVQGGNSRKFTSFDILPGKKDTVASAATITIPYGTFFHVTGTTGITDIDFTGGRDGLGAWLEFDSVLTITHNGTTLNLPGGLDITTGAGDRAYVVQDNSDNVHLLAYTPAISPPAIITPWVTYTPTFTGWGTVSTHSIWSRRVGDTLHIRGRFQAGTTTGVEARLTLGYNGTNANVSSSATKVPSLQVAGVFVKNAPFAASGYTLIGSNLGYITFGLQNAGTPGLANLNASSIVSPSGDVLSIIAEIPISGW